MYVVFVTASCGPIYDRFMILFVIFVLFLGRNSIWKPATITKSSLGPSAGHGSQAKVSVHGRTDWANK